MQSYLSFKYFTGSWHPSSTVRVATMAWVRSVRGPKTGGFESSLFVEITMTMLGRQAL